MVSLLFSTLVGLFLFFVKGPFVWYFKIPRMTRAVCAHLTKANLGAEQLANLSEVCSRVLGHSASFTPRRSRWGWSVDGLPGKREEGREQNPGEGTVGWRRDEGRAGTDMEGFPRRVSRGLGQVGRLPAPQGPSAVPSCPAG